MKSFTDRRALLRSGMLFVALFFAAFVPVLLPVLAAADEPPVLRFDPFGSRPEPKSQTRPSQEAETPFKPVLMSTIVRGDRSLVNLGGTILALQEESEGYRLLEVRAFDALFLKDGKRIRLELTRLGENP